MNLTTGTDGISSIPATRTLTSTQDFPALGVRVGDILHVQTPEPAPGNPDKTGDNNRYRIVGAVLHALTIHKDWPVGSQTGLTFRVQRTVQAYASDRDHQVKRQEDLESFWRLFTPRQWWVLDQLSSGQRNLYGEPKLNTLASGSDGATSVPGTRTLTSASADFVAAGIRTLDNVVIALGADAGSYGVAQVTQHVVTIDRNWPAGSQSSVGFIVRAPYHKFAKFGPLVPFRLHLEPPKDLLKKFGIDTERDALLVMSIPVCTALGLSPKIGDRFDVNLSENLVQQFQILTVSREDTLGEVATQLHFICTAEKTHDKVT